MNIFLAGLENSRGLEGTELTHRINHALTSYFYLGAMPPKQLISKLKRMRTQTKGYLMLDSGAYSLIMLSRKHDLSADSIRAEMMEYTEKYTDFVRRTADIFDIIVELDIDQVISYDYVLEAREGLIEACGKEKVMPVFHSTIPDALEEWKKWSLEFKYGGMGSTPRATESDLKELFNAITGEDGKPAYRVHGFAHVDMELLKKFPFWSADSTSWTGGPRWGMVVKEEHGLIGLRSKEQRLSTLKRLAKGETVAGALELHVDDYAHCQMTSTAMILEAADAYNKAGEVLTAHWAERGIRWED